MPKITLGITGLPEILGRDHGIEEHYWEPSVDTYCFENGEKISVFKNVRIRVDEALLGSNNI